MGSRLLIAFGAPAHEDDADRAVHLANHLVAQLPTARASLATGWALVQPDLEPGAHIVGSVVEVACSGLAATPPGMVHVDHSTTAARSRPIEDPPFVGRERELVIAGELLSRTLSGHGPQAISVRGEPGVGKTRLVRELRRRSPDAATWLHVRCPDRASPSAPLGALIRAHIGLPDSATESEWRAGFDAAARHAPSRAGRTRVAAPPARPRRRPRRAIDGRAIRGRRGVGDLLRRLGPSRSDGHRPRRRSPRRSRVRRLAHGLLHTAARSAAARSLDVAARASATCPSSWSAPTTSR